MFEVLIVSIGLVLVIEGILYFILADRIEFFLEIIKKLNKQKIKTISLIIALTGLCLIYFTFKFYGELK
tara:strand:- start:148 stop:354 length:207 start_codon:yes stop_codon:yes gene_type:complete